MKVYVVTEGEYSDYHIVAIFSNRKQAELKCAASYDYSIQIEEWEVDAEVLQGETAKAYQVFYSTNTGRISNVCGPHVVIKNSTSGKQGFHFSSNHTPAICKYEVEAETEEQARKIFQDRYAKAKYEYLMGELDTLKKMIGTQE